MDSPNEVIRLSTPLAEGESAVFTYQDSCGLTADGLAFRRDGRLYAYRNLCRHQPLPLDYGDAEFFTEGNEYLLCRNHGALFEPETGYCVSGPCSGATLFALAAEEISGTVVITIPATDELDLE